MSIQRKIWESKIRGLKESVEEFAEEIDPQKIKKIANDAKKMNSLYSGKTIQAAQIDHMEDLNTDIMDAAGVGDRPRDITVLMVEKVKAVFLTAEGNPFVGIVFIGTSDKVGPGTFYVHDGYHGTDYNSLRKNIEIIDLSAERAKGIYRF